MAKLTVAKSPFWTVAFSDKSFTKGKVVKR